MIRKGYSAEVDELRDLSVNAKDFITGIEAEERKKTGISTLKVGYNRIHGYYIEVTKSNLDLVPEHYSRKQTLVGGERYIIPELKEYESKVLGAEEKLKALENKVFQDILKEASEFSGQLNETGEALAETDFLVSLSVVAKRNNFTMPILTDDHTVEIINGRHPVIEKMHLGEKFIPNDLAERLEARRLDTPQQVRDRGINYERSYDIAGGKKWSESFSKASKEVLGFSNGGHGLRHSYAQERESELQQRGYSLEEARGIVSQEISHFSSETLRSYER